MISLIIWLIVVLIIVAALLGVLRAVLALPGMAFLGPYSNLIYALVVLLVVLWIAQGFTAGTLYGCPGCFGKP